MTVSFLTTDGFRDVLEIMRTDRETGYDLQWGSRCRLFLVASGRRWWSASTRTVHRDSARRDDGARSAIEHLRDGGIEAMPCRPAFLREPGHERRVAELIAEFAPGISRFLSNDINAEYREYDAPAQRSSRVHQAHMVRYIRRLVDELKVRALTANLF